MNELSTLARPYSKAAFEYSIEKSVTEDWLKYLRYLSEIIQNPLAKEILGQPSLGSNELVDTILGTYQEDIPTAFKNFIKLLAENKRLSLAPFITRQFENLKANREAVIEIALTVTEKPNDVQLKKLSSALAENLKRKISVQVLIDKDLLGGAVIQAGDMVIDNSIRGKLTKLADSLNT